MTGYCICLPVLYSRAMLFNHSVYTLHLLIPNFLLSDQCKEIEANNRMGKTRDLFKKIRDTKETFHVTMGMLKGRNNKDLTEAKATRKRGQEYRDEP